MAANSTTSNIDTDLVGPLYAEAFDTNEELIKYFISTKGSNTAYDDPFVGTLLKGKRTILSGVRGTGKTMILKTSEAILKEKCLNGDLKYLPVYISYSGFRSDVSLQEEMELSGEELRIAKEVFRGYFFMTILYEVLESIEDLGLDKNVSLNWFGLRTKFGIKNQVKKAIQTFKRLGFRNVIKNKKAGIGTAITIKALGEIELGPTFELGSEISEVTLDDMQKSSLFKETIEAICEAYGIEKIYFLFDEVHYLKFLQAEFFDVLFGFRNDSKISFSISAYPTFMDYGQNFDIPDDAKDTDISSVIYKPTKNEFEKPLFNLVESRIQNFGNIHYNEVISDEAVRYLILLCNGNPRMLLQIIDHIWKKNANKKIAVSSITQDLIIDMVDAWYMDFLYKQARRFKTNEGTIKSFLNVITSRLKNYNNRNEMPVCFFLISEEIFNKFNDTIDLLLYSRIIDKIRISSFGSSKNAKGRLYLLNPMVAIYYGAFTSPQIPKLPELLKHALDKDKKIQFASIAAFKNENSEEINISCPRLEDGTCTNVKCNDTYSEQWSLCPYHGFSLELRLPLPEEIDIKNINLSTKMQERLRREGIQTLKDIIDADLEGLQKIQLIGPIRSKNIFYAAKEYIDDNL